ncbi:MAG: hypothetical protein KGQ66_05495 [Acidobacteriota bacterium]|nr:hypothetical protein [Acidobacteriota bacterium]
MELSKTRKRVAAVAALALPISGLAAAVLPSSSAHATNTGTARLEICKDVSNGFIGGTSFDFTVSGAVGTVSVAPNTCKGVTVPAGSVTVTEKQQAGWALASVKYTGGSKTRKGNSVTVSIAKGADQTLTFTNKGIYGFLKICKTTPSSSGLAGHPFTFTENGTGKQYTAIANGACSKQTRWPVGSVVPIAEVGTSGTVVDSITSNGMINSINTAAQTVNAVIQGGVTVVTYDNIPTPPSTTGYIEVCKNAGDPYVDGHTFMFSVVGSGANATVPVTAPGCSQQIAVPNAGSNGSVTVTEQEYAPFAVQSITGAKVVSANPVNASAVVAVTAGDPSTESIVTFTNKTNDGLFKVCKIAGPGIAAGAPYTFSVNSGDSLLTVPAGQCSPLQTAPLGSKVNVQEVGLPANVGLTSVSVAPVSNDLGSSVSAGANFTVGSGVTEADFTNTAFGSLKICKVADDPYTVGHTFSFSTSSGGTYSLTPSGWGSAGAACTSLIGLPVGNVTVTEGASSLFHSNGVWVVQGSSDTPLGSVSSATVSITQGGVTELNFHNAVNYVPVELCLNNSPILQSAGQNATVVWTVSGFKSVSYSPVMSPSCTDGFALEVPAVNVGGGAVTLNASAAIISNGTQPGINVVFGPSDSFSGSLAAAGPYNGGGTKSASQSFTVGPMGGNLTFTTVNG